MAENGGARYLGLPGEGQLRRELQCPGGGPAAGPVVAEVGLLAGEDDDDVVVLHVDTYSRVFRLVGSIEVFFQCFLQGCTL